MSNEQVTIKEFKWFEQKEYSGKRYHLYEKTSSGFVRTPWFIDRAEKGGDFTLGKRYGLYGSGMSKSGNALCFGGFSKLKEAKELAESKVTK